MRPRNDDHRIHIKAKQLHQTLLISSKADMSTTIKILQTALQKRNTINEISFCITSYTCYINTTTMSGNLKRKQCAYDPVFKLKVVQYADNCHNNRQTAQEFTVSDRQVHNGRKSVPQVMIKHISLLSSHV